MSNFGEQGINHLPRLDRLASGRFRSDGILCVAGLKLCKDHNIETAYDPLQGGWVPESAGEARL